VRKECFAGALLFLLAHALPAQSLSSPNSSASSIVTSSLSASMIESISMQASGVSQSVAMLGASPSLKKAMTYPWTSPLRAWCSLTASIIALRMSSCFIGHPNKRARLSKTEQARPRRLAYRHGMELKLPPALVEALIAREREFNAALVSLTATINWMYSDAGDVPLNAASVIRAAVSAPEGASGLSALVLPGGQLGEVAYRRGAEARFK
jgi:hypothetical protein